MVGVVAVGRGGVGGAAAPDAASQPVPNVSTTAAAAIAAAIPLVSLLFHLMLKTVAPLPRVPGRFLLRRAYHPNV